MGWRETAIRSGEIKLRKAGAIVSACEQDLGRTLSDGERRDLLKDNTNWDSELVSAIVAEMRGQ